MGGRRPRRGVNGSPRPERLRLRTLRTSVVRFPTVSEAYDTYRQTVRFRKTSIWPSGPSGAPRDERNRRIARKRAAARRDGSARRHAREAAPVEPDVEVARKSAERDPRKGERGGEHARRGRHRRHRLKVRGSIGVRRTLEETIPTPPSSLNLDQHGSQRARASRVGGRAAEASWRSPAPITGGDVDASWEQGYSPATKPRAATTDARIKTWSTHRQSARRPVRGQTRS